MNLKQPLLLMAGAGRDSNNVSSKEELTLKNKFNTKGENLSDLDQTGDRVCQMGGSIRNREVRQSAGEIIIVFISTVYQMTAWRISLAFFSSNFHLPAWSFFSYWLSLELLLLHVASRKPQINPLWASSTHPKQTENKSSKCYLMNRARTQCRQTDLCADTGLDSK